MTKEDEFWEWYGKGLEEGWVEEACATHDGIPSTEAEDNVWEDVGDPCQHILRVWGPGGRAAQPDDLGW